MNVAKLDLGVGSVGNLHTGARVAEEVAVGEEALGAEPLEGDAKLGAPHNAAQRRKNEERAQEDGAQFNNGTLSAIGAV